MPSRPNSAVAKLIDEAIQLPDRRAAAKLMAEHGVNFRTVVRVLDRGGRRRLYQRAKPLPGVP
jgi:hypothetical protein